MVLGIISLKTALWNFFTLILYFQLSGVGVLGVGIWVKVDKNVVNMQHLVEFDSNDKQLEIAANILIGFGSFVLLISALGFFAACTQKKIFIGLVGWNSCQLMRLWYLSHRRPAKAQASLRIRAVSPEPSLFAHMNYGSSRRVRPQKSDI